MMSKVILQPSHQVTVELTNNNSAKVVLATTQGPPGPPGLSGGGFATVRETVPPVAEAGQLWYQPSTNGLQVYDGTAWSGIRLDAGHY